MQIKVRLKLPLLRRFFKIYIRFGSYHPREIEQQKTRLTLKILAKVNGSTPATNLYREKSRFNACITKTTLSVKLTHRDGAINSHFLTFKNTKSTHVF